MAKLKSERCSTGHGTGAIMPLELRELLDRGRHPCLSLNVRASHRDHPRYRKRRRLDRQAGGKKNPAQRVRLSAPASAFVSWVRQSWRKVREGVSATAVLLALLLVAAPARAQDAPGVPAPVSSPVKVSIVAGGDVVMGGEADAAITPLVRIAVEMPLAQAELAPRLHVDAHLAGLQGATVELEDPTTFRALEFTLGLSQRFSRRINAAVEAKVGFATRLGTDPTPRDKAPRFWSVGVRFATFGRGWLSVGVGMDQRLTGAYQPAASVAGGLQLYQLDKGALAGANVQLLGDALLGLDLSARWPGYDGGGRDVVRIGIGVGR